MSWSVWRTGGRRHSFWTIDYLGTEHVARKRFEALRGGELKAGAAKLVDDEERVIARCGKARAK